MEKDEWESHGQLPIELSGVRLATLTVPYTVSPKTGLASSVSLSWPPKQVPSRFMDQDPRMMVMPGMMSGTPSLVSGGIPGNMPLMQGPPGMMGVQGMMSGGYPPQTGPFAINPYMDPMMMKDMREAMAEIQAGYVKIGKKNTYSNFSLNTIYLQKQNSTSGAGYSKESISSFKSCVIQRSRCICESKHSSFGADSKGSRRR